MLARKHARTHTRAHTHTPRSRLLFLRLVFAVERLQLVLIQLVVWQRLITTQIMRTYYAGTQGDAPPERLHRDFDVARLEFLKCGRKGA